MSEHEAWWRVLLREIVVTLDALLGGDHRQQGHRAPLANGPEPTQPPPKPASANEDEA